MKEKSYLLVLLMVGVALAAVEEEDLGEKLLSDVSSNCALVIQKREEPTRLQEEDATFETSGVFETCIPYPSVQTAMDLSNKRFPLSKIVNSTDIEAVVNHLGNFAVETTGIIANKHGLSAVDIFEQLPLLDTKETEMYRFCPKFLKFPKCKERRYRAHDGMCNNLENPHWGAANVALRRMLPPTYSDGVSKHRFSVLDGKLISVRQVSSTVHYNVKAFEQSLCAFFNAWGQVVAHDVSLTAIPKGKGGKRLTCCGKPSEKRHPACLPISVPRRDPFFSQHSRSCLEFTRASVGLGGDCKLGPLSQRNSVTSFLDGSFVYSPNKTAAGKLRSGMGGLLRGFSVSPDLQDLLPVMNDDKCESDGVDCAFVAGDTRVNQQPAIAIMHMILHREHNRIATELGRINVGWSDEKLYQEARHMVSAIIQHITYNEYLPLVLSQDLMKEHDLEIKREGYYEGYDPNVEPTLPAEFVLAHRFGHSLIQPTMQRWSIQHEFLSSHRLRDLFLNTEILLKPGEVDHFISGLLNQKPYAMDRHLSEEITNFLFRKPGEDFGSDLASMNMQRSLDMGVATYNDVREMCGLERATEWNDLSESFQNDTLRLFSELYKTPQDLDLWSAGIAETPREGSLVGPVLGCVLAKTFSALKRGDRFWFENPGFPSSFTREQLDEIRKVKLSTLICDNTDELETVQEFALLFPHPERNPRISCDSSRVGRINFDKWRED